MSIIVDIVCVVRPGKQMKGGALVNCNLLDVVSGDLYIYCMALFIDVKLMMMMMMMKVLNFGVQKIYVNIQKFKNCMKPNTCNYKI